MADRMQLFRGFHRVSLALFDSAGSCVSRPFLQSSGYGSGTLRSTCTFSFPKFGLLFLQKTSVPRLLSAPRIPLHTEVLKQYLTLITSDVKTETSRPLAIIISWLMAKRQHVEKYANIYLQRGYDVLIVNLPSREMFLPESGSQVLAENLLKYIEEHQEYQKFVVHSFSVGAYLFSEMLVKLKNDPNKQSSLMNRLNGLIFDSAVDYSGASKGISKSFIRNKLVSRILELNINTYFKLMHEKATKHYIKASETLHSTVLPCPALMLVSEGDVIANPEDSMQLANAWRENGADVHLKCWPKSGHCSHMMSYPKEYQLEVDTFLDKIGANQTEKGNSTQC